ncbi:MAG: PP2C family protein-serine/threonine phosphatase [Gemmataceae bacterium]
MADFILRTGCRSVQGLRPNNEDRFLVDAALNVFMVADGMGGQERGEQASGMAVEIVPQILHKSLAAHDPVAPALRKALAEANQAIVHASQNQPPGRRMGTTAVVAVEQQGQVYVTGLGDSRAYLIRGDRVEQLTVDHSVAQALVAKGVFTPEEARQSPLSNVLHKFLGCAEMSEDAEVRPFTPAAGDRLLLASDGLTNHVSDEDLCQGIQQYPDPQSLADHLVNLALERGSRDNVTCVVVAFEQE